MRQAEQATGGVFSNYRVLIDRNADGSLNKFTFKIEPGETHENTAVDILEQEGMPFDIVKRSREIVGSLA